MSVREFSDQSVHCRLSFILAGLMIAMALEASMAHADCVLSGMIPIHSLGDAGANRVRVRGVVTARFPGLHGYFLETSRKHWDGDPATSEGIFVYIGSRKTSVTPGTALVIGSHPTIFHGMPELTHAKVLKRCGRQSLPPAVTIARPHPARRWDDLLGMRLRFAQPLVVAGLSDFGRYGEVRVTTGTRPFAPTALSAPGAPAVAMKREATVGSLWLDDGSTGSHLAAVELAGRHFNAAHPLRAGDRLTDLEGIAYFAFGRKLVEPVRFKFVRGANPRRMPDELDGPAGLRVVSFNLDNYFNRAFDGPRFPTERGADNLAAFHCQRDKLVSALAAMRPALAGLQEIENNGSGERGALSSLVAALDSAVPDADYRYIHPAPPRLGDGLIAPALVYDATRLAVAGKVAVLDPRTVPRTAAVGMARPVLAAAFRVHQSGLVFSAAVVHLRSKLSACGHGLDSHAGAGHCAVARAAASRRIDRWLAGDPTGAGSPRVLLLGDFNAYPKEQAITRLTGSGWIDLAARFVPAGKRYTEVYRGRAGELDYIFATPAMLGHVAGAAIWHGNADEARAVGYQGSFASCDGRASPWRASDHDPVIVMLKP